MLLELRLEALEQREGVGGGAGKARDDVALAEAADLPRIRLHDGGSQRDLAVAGDDDLSALADGEDGCGAPALLLLLGHCP